MEKIFWSEHYLASDERHRVPAPTSRHRKMEGFWRIWGATLGLVYAQHSPERISAIVLRGVFMCSRRELESLYHPGGASAVFSVVWQEYVGVIPKEERGDLLAAYHRRLVGEDDTIRREAARAWSQWETKTNNLLEDEGLVNALGGDVFAQL